MSGQVWLCANTTGLCTQNPLITQTRIENAISIQSCPSCKQTVWNCRKSVSSQRKHPKRNKNRQHLSSSPSFSSLSPRNVTWLSVVTSSKSDKNNYKYYSMVFSTHDKQCMWKVGSEVLQCNKLINYGQLLTTQILTLGWSPLQQRSLTLISSTGTKIKADWP